MTNYNLTVADIIDQQREQKIWTEILESFQSSPLVKRFQRKSSYLASYTYLRDLLSGAAFTKQWGDAVPHYRAQPYFYDDLIGFEEKRRWPFSLFLAPRPITTVSLFKEHLDRMKRQPFNRDKREMVERIENALSDFPSLAQERKGRLTDHPVRSVPLVAKHGNNPKDAYAHTAVPAQYKTSHWKSIGTSMLLGGVSRIAIASAIGASGGGVIVGAVLGGVIAGAVTSYYNNRDVIKREVSMESTFWGRMKARWRGFRKSYSKTQFALNVGASALGVTFAPAVFETIAENVPFPKIAQDFAAAAQTQISTALEWGNEKAVLAASYIGSVTDMTMANAASALDTTRELLAGYNVINHDNVTAGIPAEPDPLMQYASMDGVIVIEDENPDISTDNITRIMPDDVAPAVEPEPVSELPADPVALAFADVGDAPQADERAVQLVNNYAQAYMQASAPVPTNDVLAYTADDLRAARAIEQQLVPAPAAEKAVESVAAATPVATAEQETIAVKNRDNFWKITRTDLGYASSDGVGRWAAIEMMLAANPHMAADPASLTVGDKIIVPDLDNPATPRADCTDFKAGRAKGCVLPPTIG